jgi:hypothetical protein
MKNMWAPTKYLLGGYRCTEHAATKELSLIGRYGEIWAYDAFTFKAIVYSHRIAKKFLSKELWPVQLGDEILFSFQIADLPVWIKRLHVPSKSSTQANIADQSRFNALAKSNTLAANVVILSLAPQIHAQMIEPIPTKPSNVNRANLPAGTENLDDLEAGTNEPGLSWGAS